MQRKPIARRQARSNLTRYNPKHEVFGSIPELSPLPSTELEQDGYFAKFCCCIELSVCPNRPLRSFSATAHPHQQPAWAGLGCKLGVSTTVLAGILSGSSYRLIPSLVFDGYNYLTWSQIVRVNGHMHPENYLPQHDQ